MPHIAVMMYPGRNDEIKSHLAERIKEVIMEELKVSDTAVSVSMFDIEKEAFPKAMESIPKANIVLPRQ